MTAVAVREATEPPEARGITRDAVRMMVAHRTDLEVVHTHAHDLPQFLDEGDLIVVNTSGTLAAALDALGADGTPLVVHLSQRLPAGLWLVELRRPNGRATEPWFEDPPGSTLQLVGGGLVHLATRFESSTRLWVATLELPVPLLTYLAVHGRPIRYGYVTRDWPLDIYQNVYAREPGSAEMPSAGRPFTPELVTRLVAKGVAITPLVLHTGVSSLEANEHPYPEWYRVAPSTAARINDARANGGRVIAIGTTVVRALETVVDHRRVVHAGEGWTDVVVTPERGAYAVDGLLTGWHEPEASHLQMLEAVGGRPVLDVSYAAAAAEGYLWHEFGDVHLILP
ncbi:MAG: S-adenosylmethionine:tRNA ribosyltransferase-isomerase [Actinomycetota bacterium]|jgi:S-adenosylmethionine:tRNA ribosyltransferase-isomerase|nr:S-adenosylmethionine:tRNA ribosyltransferase-isomerase [Actinomycetota bacterium]